MGSEDYGIDPKVINRISEEIAQVHRLGVQIGIVIGGGNIFRGAGLSKSGIDRVTGDHMGMLATVMNSLALQNALEKQAIKVRVMSAIQIHEVCEDYIRRRAIRHLEKGNITVFAAGIGNPFFTTDSAASLRAIEINADIVLKATKVDGIYSADPVKDPNAVKYQNLTYDEVIEKKLEVMDTAAVVLCRDRNMLIRIFNMGKTNALMEIVLGSNIGTIVTS
ncbi:MAG: UMP kinase [Proteobacteria bacterium]|nr:UMP kinase [Pseudomonadota bacterium]